MLTSNPNSHITPASLKKLSMSPRMMDVNIGHVFNALMKAKGLKHTCPKCKGEGYLYKSVNTYPAGCPDSGWVDQIEDRWFQCDLCKGEGYTASEYEVVTESVKYQVKQ